MKFTAKNIAYLALLTAISVITNTLTLTVPGSGIAVSFTYIPNFLAGYFFGPGAGFIVGVIGDALGCIIWPKGAWLPLLTLSAGLMGASPGLVRYLPVSRRWHIAIAYVATYIICSAGINTFTLWHAYAATKKTFWVYLIAKMPVSMANMAANLVLNFLLMPLFDRIIAPRAKRANAQPE
ncbi:MAG: folate family ECF transporter S component [Clostridia bacterium]|nr:folate family ECF transporter S component [Clostridia bacterium]